MHVKTSQSNNVKWLYSISYEKKRKEPYKQIVEATHYHNDDNKKSSK